MAKDVKIFSDAQARFMLHLGGRIAHGIAELDKDGARRLRLIIRRMLLRRSGMERFQVRLLLCVIRWLPAVVYMRPFERIPVGAQDWLIARLENAPIKLVRAGIWGLKTLLLMGYYGQAQTATRIHYHPDFENGNGHLGGGEDARP